MNLKKFAMGSGARLILVLCILGAITLIDRPIRFHQTAHARGLTMNVPPLWGPVKGSPPGVLVSLRRQWGAAGSVSIVDTTAFEPSASFTMTAARQTQARVIELQSKDPNFSNPRPLDLSAGRFNAVCEEANINTDYRSLICYVIGTPLQFEFLGKPSSEQAAQAMLASLT